ncbi:YceI family protein [Streptomyces beijiangensis]|uniref:YceI family protein n=1 Tax=Streptomyces beijiangensis TaxID=163361 RepID=A0A939FEA5_9ACTN|nr:YceI family protein [Streptomyces beijiangensis]MBO0516413.1 YceI family protein [Streptomyces beijiangensis]
MENNRDHTTTAPPLGRYRIDTGASAVVFRTRHLFGLAPVRGTFAVRSGTVDIAEPLGASAVRVEIDAASFTTGSGARDGAVRSARFLDTARHPVLTYATDGITEAALTGTLTVCGVSRPVTLAIEEYAMTPEGFTARATTRIDRTEFGVTASRGMAGRYLEVELTVSCVR